MLHRLTPEEAALLESLPNDDLIELIINVSRQALKCSDRETLICAAMIASIDVLTDHPNALKEMWSSRQDWSNN